jgi:acyl-coenzyme A thioesterase PaaI-like protein
MSQTPARWIGFFPAAADPATHLASVPYARALGFVWERGDHDGVRMRMPFSAGVSTADGQGIDPLATLGLLDHACSAAVYLSLDSPTLIATIDLRTEFAEPHEAGSDVICTARTQFNDGAFALVRAQTQSAASGRVLAYASSAYAIGSHPGMKGKNPAPLQVSESAPGPVDRAYASFAQTLGLESGADGLEMPFRHRLIGSLSLPALHGGSTGAALVCSALAIAQDEQGGDALWRPLTVDVHYLSAVRASTVRLRPAIRKAGRRSCVVSVSALQGADAREVTHAECLLVRSSP